MQEYSALDTGEIEYTIPNTIPEVFQSVRDWVSEAEVEKRNYLGFADSLAAFRYGKKEEGMGRRAKEFGRNCEKLAELSGKVLMVSANQIELTLDLRDEIQKARRQVVPVS